MFKKNTPNEQKQVKTKSSNKKKLIIGLATAGTLAFAGVLVGGSIAATSMSTSTASEAPKYVSWNTLALGSTKTGGTSYSGADIQLSPVSFNNSINDSNSNFIISSNGVKKQSVFSLTKEALNNLGIPWLSVFNGQNLQIVNYYLSTKATFTSTSLSFAAFQILNPNNNKVQFNYFLPNSTQKSTIMLQPGEKIWIYMENGDVIFSTRNTLSPLIVDTFDSSDVLYTISNLSNAFIPTKNGKATPPKLPVTTPIEMCTSILNSHGQSIVQKDLYNLFNYFGSGNNINISAQGTKAQIRFQKLDVNWSGSRFIPASESPTDQPQFVLGGLTGELSVTVPSLGQTLSFDIDNNQPLTFNLTPIVLWQQDGTIQTSPAISQNTLSGTIFSHSEVMPSSSSTPLHLGYGLNAANAQSELNLVNAKTGAKFDLINIAFSYLFYNFWMTNRNITSSIQQKNIKTPSTASDLTFSESSNFGSVYNNGSVSLKGSQSIPKTWINALPMQGINSTGKRIYQEVLPTGTFSINSESADLQQYISNNLTNLSDGRTIDEFSVDAKNCPLLFTQLLQQTNLSNLNSNLKVKAFNVIVQLQDNTAILVVQSASVYNASYYNNLKNDAVAYSNIYYLNVKGSGVPVAIYPLDNLTNIAQIPLDYYVHINSNMVAINLNFNNPFDINFASINNNQFVNANTALELINKDSYYNSKIIEYIAQKFNSVNSSFSNLEISNLNYVYENGFIVVSSFDLINKSNSCIALNFFNSNYVFSPYQELTIRNHPFTINGLILGLNLKQNVDIANSNYPYLMLRNINLDGNENPDAQHNIDMRNAISNLISNGYLQVLNYQACVVTNSNNEKTLEFNSLTLKNNSTINSILLNPNSLNPIEINPGETINLNADGSSVYASLTNFKTSLVPANKTIANEYLQNCRAWLQTLTATDIQNDFANMANVTNNYVTSMPSDAILNYSNFDCKISNYDPATQTATLSKMTWDISGEATNIPLLGHIGLSVTLNQTTAVKFKLIPVIYFTYNGMKDSYPQVIASRSDLQTIDTIQKYVAVATNLNYSNVPNIQDATNIRYGYYLEPADGACQYAGSGLSLKLSGADATYKPALNISYAFNQSVMFNHWSNNQIVPISSSNVAPYGSYAPNTVAKTAVVNSYVINPYGAQNLDINQVNLSDSSISNFVQLDNYLTNPNNYSIISNALNLPNTLNITNINIGGATGIGELTVNNYSNITYKIVENINDIYYAYFILPNQNNQQILFSNSSLINVENNSQNLSNSITYNISTLFDNKNSGAVNFVNAAWDWSTGISYMYPLLFSSYSKNSYYSFDFNNVGPQHVYTMDSPSWKAMIYYDHLWPYFAHNVEFQMSWVAEMLGFDSALTSKFEGYKIYISSSSSSLVISSVEINHMWINGLDLILNPGNRCSLN